MTGIQILLVAVWIACIPSQNSAPSTDFNDNFPEIPGYEIIRDYPVFEPDNLWDYINGAADAYLSFQFRELHIAEYLNENGDRIKVEIYRHRSDVYAYGIYCSERFPDYNFIDIGSQGYAEPGLVHFLAGPNYVKVMTGSKNLTGDELVMVSKQISDWLEKDPSLPAMLRVFPEEGKINKSECFIASNFLGHAFLNDAFVANYDLDGEKFSIFIFNREDPTEYIQMVEEYLRFAREEIPQIEDGQYSFEDRYNGEIVLVLEGSLLFGFLECKDQAIIEKYSRLIQSRFSQ